MSKQSILAFTILLMLFSVQAFAQQTAEECLNRGNVLCHQGKYEEALQAFDNAIELNPEYSAAWYSKGEAFYQLGWAAWSAQSGFSSPEVDVYNQISADMAMKYWDEAIHSYCEAINLNSSFSEAWIGKGYALATEGGFCSAINKSLNSTCKGSKFNEAIRAYDKAIELNPQDAKAWVYKGQALDNLGRYDEAILAYDNVLWNNDNSNDSSNDGSNDSRIQKEAKDGLERAWYNKGIALDDQGRYDEAIKALNNATRLYPEDAGAWYSKGEALSHLGKYNDAIDAYNEAIKIEPNFQSAWYGKAFALRQIGRTSEADDALASGDKTHVYV